MESSEDRKNGNVRSNWQSLVMGLLFIGLNAVGVLYIRTLTQVEDLREQVARNEEKIDAGKDGNSASINGFSALFSSKFEAVDKEITRLDSRMDRIKMRCDGK